MDDASHPSDDAASIVREVLRGRTFAARARRLHNRRPSFGEPLRLELHTRALGLLRKDPRDAAEHARLAVIVAEACGTAEQRADGLCVRAQACITQGEHRAALHVLTRAAKSAVPGSSLAARIDTLTAQACMHLERYAAAAAAAQRALASHEARYDDAGVIWATMTLADLAYRRDDPREALRFLNRAERRVGLAPRSRLRGAIAVNRANALDARHRFRAAARHFERARALFEGEGCTHTVAQVDYNAAYAEALRGRYADALRRYVKAEAVFASLGDERHLAHVDLDRAEVHVQLGMASAAESFAQDADRRFRALGLRKESAQAQYLAARAAAIAGETGRATDRFERAARAFRRQGLAGRVFQCELAMAQIARTAGDGARALQLLKRAEGRLDGTNRTPSAVASVGLARAWLDLDDGDAAAALRRADEAMRSCRRIHAPCMRIEAHRVRGRALGSLGRTGEAIAAFAAAADELERYRGGVPADEYMTAFLAARTGVYEDAVSLLVEAGLDEQALAYVERARSRSLLDLMETRAAAPRGADAGDGLSARAAHLRERLNAVYGRILRLDEGGSGRGTRAAQRALKDAESLEGELADVLRTLRLRDREAGRAASVPDVVRIRAALAPDTALVECYLAADSLFTFVVTRDDLRVVRRRVPARDVRLCVDRMHFQILRAEDRDAGAADLGLRATRAALSRLADVVLGDALAEVTAKRLVVVPHGVLHQVPFHALPWGEGWLCDAFEIVYAPSAAVYERCGRRTDPARGDAAVLALPDEAAPSIADEARAVAGALGTGRVLVGGDATFARLAEEMRTARVVHVATHGMFRRSQPTLSSIRLADRWVNAYDLQALDVRSELVVLATCESGIAAVSRGDDVLGVTRGLLCAGARAVLTSQWRVDDAVTHAFMTRFHGELRTRGDAAAALRAAMAAVRAEHPHPYHWSPFFLTGQPSRAGNGAEVPTPAAAPAASFAGRCGVATLERS